MSQIDAILITYDQYLSSLDIVDDEDEYMEVLVEKISWMETANTIAA